jgi:hypothetical protein
MLQCLAPGLLADKAALALYVCPTYVAYIDCSKSSSCLLHAFKAPGRRIEHDAQHIGTSARGLQASTPIDVLTAAMTEGLAGTGHTHSHVCFYLFYPTWA